MQPLISVIIPTFNEAEMLETAIRSIMEQTYANLEILVVDDGSTDNTKEITGRLAQEDPRIRYLYNPLKDPYRVDWRGTNIGVGWTARNYGMDKANGEWIAFQDADDASVLNRLEIQLRLATTHNATLITTSCVDFSNSLAGTKFDVERFEQEEEVVVVEPKEIVKRAAHAHGLLARPRLLRNLMPFILKRKVPFLRRLFLGTLERYPGADNSMFFKKEVAEKVRFRPRHLRVWPAASGRGVGRDFVFQVAETFKNSWSFNYPLYLWRTKEIHPLPAGWEKYFI